MRAILLIALLAAAAHAQDADPTPPSKDPALRAQLGLPRLTANPPAIAPVQEPSLEPVQPGLTEGIDWMAGLAVQPDAPPTPSLLPEGFILRERLGTLWAAPRNLWVFLPDPQTRQPGEGAMLLAPNAVLDRLAALLETQNPGEPMLLSGLVLEYHDRNYLLLTTFRNPSPTDLAPHTQPTPRPTAEDSPAEPPPDTQSPDDSEQTEPAAPPPTEVEDLIKDLEGNARADTRRSESLRQKLLAAQREQAVGPEPVVQAAPGAPGNAPLLPEGSYLSQRRARLIRGSNGQWTLAFDNDAQDLGDGRLIVIPCRMLMQMEKRAGIAPEITITVSGRVYSSKEKGYILPTVFQIQPPSDVNPLQ